MWALLSGFLPQFSIHHVNRDFSAIGTVIANSRGHILDISVFTDDIFCSQDKIIRLGDICAFRSLDSRHDSLGFGIGKQFHTKPGFPVGVNHENEQTEEEKQEEHPVAQGKTQQPPVASHNGTEFVCAFFGNILLSF
jgi:hypothetical protein